jgi:SAM-dependent methyltransferase
MTRAMALANAQEYWERLWTSKDPWEVSWFEASPRRSVEMIEALALPPDAPIIDVGGGASRLAGELLRRGYEDLTVADISHAALEKARSSLGAEATKVKWVVADVRSHDFGRRFAAWHDRAVFHFLVDEHDRDSYLAVLRRSLAPKGHAIIATFGPDGPTRCSGLPVARYSAGELAEAFSSVASLVSDRLEVHETPSGNRQQFLYAHLETR